MPLDWAVANLEVEEEQPVPRRTHRSNRRRRRKHKRGHRQQERAQVSQDKIECAQCLEHVRQDQLRLHQQGDCPGKIVSCMHEGCQDRFRADEREEHEKRWCSMTIKREHILRARAKDLKAMVHCEQCDEEIPRRALAEHACTCPRRRIPCPACGARVEAKEMAQHRESACAALQRRTTLAEAHEAHLRPVKCPQCKDDMLERDLKSHQEDECSFRNVRCRFHEEGCTSVFPFRLRASHEESKCVHLMRRNELVEAWAARVTDVACPLCHLVVGTARIKRHIAEECPKRQVPCPNFGCNDALFPSDVTFHTLTRDFPCFLCDKCNLTKPYIYRSRDELMTVKIDPSAGPMQADTYEQITSLCDLLQKHAKLRKRIIRAFQRDYKAIYDLEEVHPLLDITDFKGMATDDWNELCDSLKQVAEDLKICSRAGGRGDVVVKILFVCTGCFENDKCPPLTTKEQYDKLPVCKIAFRRQFLLHQKNVLDECVPCEQGCGILSIRRRDMRKHLVTSCRRRRVKCPNRGCGKWYAVDDKAIHDENCEYLYEMDILIVKSRGRCEIIECDLQCGFKGMMKEVHAHEQRACPMRMVECQNAGCGMWMLAREVPAHNLVCLGHVPTVQRELEKKSWTRTLVTHPELVDYWKQKMSLRKQQVKKLNKAMLGDALDVLCGTMKGVDVSGEIQAEMEQRNRRIQSKVK